MYIDEKGIKLRVGGNRMRMLFMRSLFLFLGALLPSLAFSTQGDMRVNATIMNVSTSGASAATPLYIQWTPSNNLYTNVSMYNSSWTFYTGGILNLDFLQLNTSYTDGHHRGRFQWDPVHNFPEIGMSDVVNGSVFDEMFEYAYNDTGVLIEDGKPVYQCGTHAHTPKICLANSASAATSEVMGVTTQDIPDKQSGYVTYAGDVHDMTTLSSFSNGAKLYLDTTAGGLTSTIKPGMARVVVVGEVRDNNPDDGVLRVAKNYTPAQIKIDSMTATNVCIGSDCRTVWPSVANDNLGSHIATTTLQMGGYAITSSSSITAGRIGVSTNTSSAYLTLPAGGTAAGTAPLKFTAQTSPLSVVEPGTMELVGHSLQFSQFLKRRGVAMSQSVLIADVISSNTVSMSDSILSADHGADYLEVGKSEEMVLRGTIQQAAGAGTLSFYIEYNNVVISTITTVAGIIPAGTPFELRVSLTVRSTGISGTAQVNSVLWIDGYANVPDSAKLVTINTTVAEPTHVHSQWGVANAGNILTVNQGRVLCIEPNK